jgi:hypothetical protein
VISNEVNMNDEDAQRDALRHTIIAWREARDMSKPGSAEYQEHDRKMKQAEADLTAVGRQN